MAQPTTFGPPKAIQRKVSVPRMVVGAVSAGVAFIPGVGGAASGAISHGMDRVGNQMEAQQEIKSRAIYYQDQVRATLGMAPGTKVNVSDYIQASRMNPMLGITVKEVKNDLSKKNRESMLINGGVAAAGLVGMGGVARLGADATTAVKVGAHAIDIGKTLAGGFAGSQLAAVFHKKHVSVQEVGERIHNCLLEAEHKGMPLTQAVPANLVFLLRIAQDDATAKEIEQHYGKPFHQMNEAEQAVVMNSYPALTNAVTSEANALGQKLIQPQELMASAPNLNAGASRFSSGRTTVSGSFRDRLAAQRATVSATTTGIA